MEITKELLNDILELTGICIPDIGYTLHDVMNIECEQCEYYKLCRKLSDNEYI